MMKTSNVALIIPALNEEEAISQLLKDVPREIVTDVIVVDNGSNDNTSLEAKKFDVTVLLEPKHGYGKACLRGLQHLEKSPPDIVAFMDGDYSDDPREIDKLIKPIIGGDFDFVVGSRIRGNSEKGALPFHSIAANRFFAMLVNLLYGLNLSDLGSFKAIRYSSILALNMNDEGYGFPIEMVVKSSKNGLRILEVPLSFRRRIGISKVTGNLGASLKAGTKILYVILKYSLK